MGFVVQPLCEPAGHLPSLEAGKHEGAVPPQQGITQYWEAPHVVLPQAKGAPPPLPAFAPLAPAPPALPLDAPEPALPLDPPEPARLRLPAESLPPIAPPLTPPESEPAPPVPEPALEPPAPWSATAPEPPWFWGSLLVDEPHAASIMAGTMPATTKRPSSKRVSPICDSVQPLCPSRSRCNPTTIASRGSVPHDAKIRVAQADGTLALRAVSPTIERAIVVEVLPCDESVR